MKQYAVVLKYTRIETGSVTVIVNASTYDELSRESLRTAQSEHPELRGASFELAERQEIKEADSDDRLTARTD